MTPQAEKAIYNLLALPIGRAAEAPVIQAMKQQIAQNLSNTKVGPFPNFNFRKTFFPNQRATTLSNLVPTYTKMLTQEWIDYATEVLCQAIYYWTTISDLLNKKLINSSVTANSQKAFIYTGNLGVLAVAENPQIVSLAKTAMAEGATKLDFVEVIIKNIPSRILLYYDKRWHNGDLEIFDWLGKYVAMGGTINEIPGLLTQFYSHGLPLYPNMASTTFVNYKGYMTRSNGPTYADFPELKAIVTYSTESCGNGICLPNDDKWSNWYVSNAKAAETFKAPSSCCAEDTEILMADGSAKLITELSPNDIIQGAVGPTKPLYVSKSPLSGRKLYEFFESGGGPRLTETHPIVNPDYSTLLSDVPAALSVYPQGLYQILPNHNRTGVGQLIINETEVKVTNTANNKTLSSGSETIKALRETDTSKHGEEVYDIVLPFSDHTQVGYWAGRNGKFVLIEPELIRLKDDPFVGAAIFELLVGLAESYEKGEWQISTGDSDNNLNTYLDCYGLQIINLALKMALSNASIEDVNLEENTTDLPQAIDTFINENWTQSPTVIANIAILLGLCSRHLYVPLSNIIRNGNRFFPKTALKKELTNGFEKSDNGNYLVVSLMDMELSSNLESHGAAAITVNFKISSSHIETKTNIQDSISTNYNKTNTIFRHVYDHSTVYEMIDENDQPTLEIEITSTTNKAFLASSHTIPLSIRSFSYRKVILFDNQGVNVANIHIDVCRLTKEQLDVENFQSEDWGEKNQRLYAVALGRALVAPFSFALSRGQDVMAKKPFHLLDV